MRPRHIAYIIWTVIAVLAVICWLVPENGIAFGKWTLQWVTLSEVLGIEKDSTLSYADSTWLADMEDYEIAIDTTVVYTPPKQALQPLQPKQELRDSMLRSIADSLAKATKAPIPTAITSAKPNVTQPAEKTTTASRTTLSNVDTRQYLATFYQALDSASRQLFA